MKFSKAEVEAIIAASTRKFVPLNKLVLSKDYQARTEGSAPKVTIPELAASIHELGVLQNLIVVEVARGVYEVCAGGRRLEALELLVLNGSIPENCPIPVLVVPPDRALVASLTENIFHVPMHPADEYTAFAKLIANGKSVEDVAATFGVTPLVVKRRMKLGSVSPGLMEEFRRGQIGLDCLMVLASVDDHQRQETAWAAVPPWNRRPDYLRQLLTQGEVESDRDPVAKFVTLKTYEKAGGSLRRDLFSESDNKAYLLDLPLLERLALEKLQRKVKPLAAEGWKWIDTRVRYDRDEYMQYGELRKSKRSPSPEEAQAIAEMESRIEMLNDLLEGWSDEEADAEGGEVGTAAESNHEALPGAKSYEDMQEEVETLSSELHELQEGLYEWSPQLMAQSGCVLFVGPGGEPSVKPGLIRPQDRQDLEQAIEQAGPEFRQESLTCQPGAPSRPTHSERLMRRLTAHRVAAIQASLTLQPQVAIAALTSQLAMKEFGRDYAYQSFGEVLDARTTCNHRELTDAAEDLATSRAWQQLQEQRQHWVAKLPEQAQDYFPWMLSQPAGVVLTLLAFLIAISVKGVRGTESERQSNDALAMAVDLDMTQWWQVSGESYLNHVPKGRIMEVVAEAVDPSTASALQTLKKAEAVAKAEQLLDGKKWLPRVMRVGPIQTVDAVEQDARASNHSDPQHELLDQQPRCGVQL